MSKNLSEFYEAYDAALGAAFF